VQNRPLRFHLTGINNQNFLMQDEETGTWWQQANGKAILGPLKGNQLEPVTYDEVSLEVWRKEEPHGRVLRPIPGIEYDPSDWETQINKLPVVVHTPDWAPRTVVIGVAMQGGSKAYPLTTLRKHGLLIDQVSGTPILILLADDGKSVRVFDRRLGDRTYEFYVSDSTPRKVLDSEGGNEWNFEGIATSGPDQGQRLKRIQHLMDFWFDWRIYHPNSLKYRLED
jgi:Protein of unknown function (DUF3179)